MQIQGGCLKSLNIAVKVFPVIQLRGIYKKKKCARKSILEHEHRHSAIRFVTPGERHAGLDNEVLARRDAIYAEAKRQHPGRWSSATRNWTPRRTVWLNPDQEDPLVQKDQRLEAA